MRHILLAVFVAAAMPARHGLPRPAPLTVSAAISLTDVLTAIAEEYGRQGRGSVSFNFGASNVLARQIVSGAPVDVFISADDAQMDVVATAGMVKAGSRVALLTNQLAVIVPNDRPRTLRSMRELTEPAFRRIASGEPTAVPAGVYAKEYLAREGVWNALQSRIVPTVSVRAAVAAVESGAVDAGIVYRTDARVALRATIALVIPTALGPRIVYPAAIIDSTKAPGDAQRFLDFLRGDPGRRIFERFGFQMAAQAVPPGPPRAPQQTR
jgi:molybdate transport system substrate-binding protein